MFIKTAFDLVVALVCLVLFSPAFFTALAIKINSPGPVFFKQKRAGLNGKVFTIYTFRFMYIDAEERKKALLEQNKVANNLIFKLDNDPRITAVGAFIRKTSIDELPRLYNVLRGDMSMVGTRPPTLDEVELYEPYHQRRISIKPGITGMWQVNGRSNVVNFEQVMEYDRSCIDQWSLGLDIKLMFRTVMVVLKRKGAC